jgi:hypothetical protein
MSIKGCCPECGGSDSANWCTCCQGPEPKLELVDEDVGVKKAKNLKWIVKEREALEGELSDLEKEHDLRRLRLTEKLRALRQICPHENVSHTGGGSWCKDCNWSR